MLALTAIGAVQLVLYPAGVGSVKQYAMKQVAHVIGSGYFPSRPHWSGNDPLTRRGCDPLVKLDPGTHEKTALSHSI